MRFAELFAGAGGLSLGLERAGWTCAWHAEISEQPRAILQHRWPNVPLYGDVTTLDGAALTALHGPVDLLSGGSPCQDLSVAGKRKGLEGARSGLFYEQMRLWKETGADLCLWENVDGARSSNNGKDFGEVLRAFVGAAVPVPSDGWRSAGVAAGPLGVAAWRVLDAQFFGVPQRRRRVFVLGTRTGSVDPAEVLSLAEGVRGDTQESGEAGEGATDRARGSSHEARGVACYPMDARQYRRGDKFTKSGRGGGDASEDGTGRGTPVVVPIQEVGKRTGVSTTDPRAGIGIGADGDPMYTLQAGAQHGVMTYSTPAIGDIRADDVSSTITKNAGGGGETQNPAFVVDPIITPTLSPGAHNGSPGTNGQDAAQYAEAMFAVTGIPRRLTPRECERLMGWPDDHTLVPYNGKPLSDSARYKACGNGVASVHSHWIGWRLRLAIEERRASEAA